MRPDDVAIRMIMLMTKIVDEPLIGRAELWITQSEKAHLMFAPVVRKVLPHSCLMRARSSPVPGKTQWLPNCPASTSVAMASAFGPPKHQAALGQCPVG